MPIKPPRPPIRKPGGTLNPPPQPPQQPPQQPHYNPIENNGYMQQYPEQPSQIYNPQQQYSQQMPPPPPQGSVGGDMMRNVFTGFVFMFAFGGIMSLIVPRKTRIVVDHSQSGPLTQQQMIDSVPLHNNRMMNFQHVVKPAGEGAGGHSMGTNSQNGQNGQNFQNGSHDLQTPIPPPQSFQRYPPLPPPVALPQNNIPSQSLYQAPQQPAGGNDAQQH